MNCFRSAALAALLVAASTVVLPGASDGVSRADDPGLAALRQQIEAGQAADAERALRAADARDPGNADILNLLGYANRKLARYQVSRGFYTRALAIDPRHKGALEYLGELELETGDVDAARALLARLRDICPSGCHELDDLLKAFEDLAISPEGGDS